MIAEPVSPLAKKNPLTYAEATGSNGGGQTTFYEVNINGKLVGKYSNDTTRMMKGKKEQLESFYPKCCTPNDPWHTEDYMLADINRLISKNGGLEIKYPRNFNIADPDDVPLYDIITVAGDKTCCIRCANNIISFQNSNKNVRFRIKAAKLHTSEPQEVLIAAKIPIRSWSPERIARKKGKKISDLPEAQKKRTKYLKDPERMNKFTYRSMGWGDLNASRSKSTKRSFFRSRSRSKDKHKT